MTFWRQPWSEVGLPPLELKERRCKGPPFPKHKLPKGWRWLTMGEWVKAGDYCCDPRVMPVKILVDHAWQMSETCHPVRRRTT
jgi:hypothetical protein